MDQDRNLRIVDEVEDQHYAIAINGEAIEFTQYVNGILEQLRDNGWLRTQYEGPASGTCTAMRSRRCRRSRSRRRRGRSDDHSPDRRVPAAAALLAVGAAACSSPSDEALSRSITPLGPPTSTATTAPPPTTTPPTCKPRASLRPESDSVPDPSQFPPGSTMATIRDDGMLVVGVDEGTQGWGYRDPKSAEIKGLDVDLLRVVAEAIFRDGDPDAHLKFKTLTTAERITAVANGDVDMVASLLTATCGRWETVNFSTEYYEARQGVLVPRDSRITSLADLSGRTVCRDPGLDVDRRHPRQGARRGPVPGRGALRVPGRAAGRRRRRHHERRHHPRQLPGPGEAPHDQDPRTRVDVRARALRHRDRQGPRGPGQVRELGPRGHARDRQPQAALRRVAHGSEESVPVDPEPPAAEYRP